MKFITKPIPVVVTKDLGIEDVECYAKSFMGKPEGYYNQRCDLTIELQVNCEYHDLVRIHDMLKGSVKMLLKLEQVL